MIHGTGTSSLFYESAGDGLGELARVTAPDRPGWGLTPAPEDYRRTSIAEQATAVSACLPADPDSAALVVGEGLGGVVGLEVALARPDQVAAVAMIDPPIFGLLTDATPGVSIDTERVREAVELGGPAAAYELFLAGDLTTLGAGAERLAQLADRGPAAPRTFLVELPAVPAWSLEPERFRRLEAPVLIASAADSPEILRQAADSVVDRIPGAERLDLASAGPSAAVEALSVIAGRSG